MAAARMGWSASSADCGISVVKVASNVRSNHTHGNGQHVRTRRDRRAFSPFPKRAERRSLSITTLAPVGGGRPLDRWLWTTDGNLRKVRPPTVIHMWICGARHRPRAAPISRCSRGFARARLPARAGTRSRALAPDAGKGQSRARFVARTREDEGTVLTHVTAPSLFPLLVGVLAVVATACEHADGTATRAKHGTIVRGHGISVRVPAGWSGRVEWPARNFARVVHLASFPLPRVLDGRGHAAARKMRKGDIYINMSVDPRFSTRLLRSRLVLRRSSLRAHWEGKVPEAALRGSTHARTARATVQVWVTFGVPPHHGALTRVNRVLATLAARPTVPATSPLRQSLLVAALLRRRAVRHKPPTVREMSTTRA